jgi:NADH dehydrogenase
MTRERDATVLVVGGGFGGLGCAKALAKHGVRVLLLDRNNYHQFQPLLYQVATGGLAASDVGTPLRTLLRRDDSVDVKHADVVSIDPDARTATTSDGDTYSGDYLVLAVGSEANFFHIPGAAEHAFPLYSLYDAQRLRSRVFELFDAADRDRSLVDRGALTFVVVGGGATGVEIAGALADLVGTVLPEQYRDLAVSAARIHLVDRGEALLAPFSASAHEYAARVLGHGGVRIDLGASVERITVGSVVLADGTRIPTRCAIWAGGLQAAGLCDRAGLPRGQGGRFRVGDDLTVDGYDKVYAVGDAASALGSRGQPFPQLGSVALQAGRWAARNIKADLDGRPRTGFRYHDKGIMAMIGRRAAIAEVGARRYEVHGTVAFAAWLGVHAWLMSGMRARLDALVSWGWDYFSGNRSPALIDRTDAADIDWGDGDWGDGDGVPPEKLEAARTSSTP